MFRLRIFRKWLSMVLVIAIGVPWLPLSAKTNSPAASIQTTPLAHTSSAPAADKAINDLQTALDLLVGQAAAGSGLKITAVNSQLEQATLQNSAARQAGSGQWTVVARDDKGQAITLQGPLNFEATSDRALISFSAEAKINGTLKGNDTELKLDLKESGDRGREAGNQAVTFRLTLTRGGTASNITINRSNELKPIAYGLSQVVSKSSIEKDGQAHTWIQTVTSRDLGKGESEVWLQAALASGANKPSDVSLDQHFFQKAAGSALTQYYDRYNLQVPGDTYSLQAPATAKASLDGTLTSDITLIDAKGQTLNPGSSKGPGLQSPALNGRVLLSGSPAQALLISRLASILSSGSYSPLLGACSDLTSNTGSFLIGVAASIAAAYLFGAELVLFDLIVGNLATTIIGAWQSAALANAKTQEERDAINAISLLLQLAIGAAGITTPGGISGIIGNLGSFLTGAGVGKACNADPYFMYADIRPATDDLNGASIRVLRVTGGLITNTIGLAGPTTASPPSGNQIFNDYTDRPSIFVGGTAPAGATSIGTWTWDNTQTFGVAASHTSGAIDGPHKHYMIHTSDPLTVTSDDNLIQYVYLDPKNPPRELLLQFYIGDGDGEHRAYWGGNDLQTGGQAGTPALYPIGALPPTGGWVRLRVPADQLGLSGQPINGVLYGSYDGQVWWGPTTTSSRLTDNAPDELQVQGPQALPETFPGASITFRLAQPAKVSLQIVDAKGNVVRSVLKDQNRPAGYQAVIWDAMDDKGAIVADSVYRYQFSVDDKAVADGPVSISPLVANIVAPTPAGLVRGNNIPIVGEAYGTTFKDYTLEYGAGLSPTTWTPIATSLSPIVLPPANRALANINAGNLANWNAGLDEFLPWKDTGLNGIYTLRLRVTGKDDREVSDRVTIIVGRLAAPATGGTIASPDGKAHLNVPPFAAEDSFALMALVPAAQLDPNQSWQESLPSDKQLASDVYEIFPADEKFRQPATLEIPYNAGSAVDKLGVLLGDGTAEGWHYLGGTVDAAKQVIRVDVTEFGGKRALVAAFTSDQFGAPTPYRTVSAPFTFAAADAAPIVSSSTAPVAFYDDFEATPGEWAALDRFGTQLDRVKASEAGLTNSVGSVLKVTHLDGGARLVRVRSTPYDATKYSLISFDYRLPGDYAPNVLVASNGIWYQLRSGDAGSAGTKYYHTLKSDALTQDDAWHHYQADVLAMLRADQPEATNFQIDEIVLGQVNQSAYGQAKPIDNGAVGDAYYIDNFAALNPVNATQLAFQWTASVSGTVFSAYAFTLDQKADTQPQTPAGDAATANATLPKDGTDGLWYFHVRGRGSNGQWTATANYPVLIDRQPPVIGQPDPAPNGAGAPDFISVPIADATSGLDPAKLQLQINGKPYATGPGARYEDDLKALAINSFNLKPALPPIINGQKVELSLNVADYAGNQLAAPLTWSFTADRPKVAGDQFRTLTQDGGHSPALSPDGSLLAFVANRSGTDKVWIMQATDYGEQSNTAHQLINNTAHEADPAWSPDGKSIAYVSDVNGSAQIWLADANGNSAKTITAGSDVVASPTWSPDGKSLAFVKNGNIAQLNIDGSGLHVLTDYPDRSVQAVRWQPNGNLLAVDFKLYQETIEIYDPATNQLQPLTEGGAEHDPAWLNSQTILYAAPASAGQPDAVWKINLDGSGQNIIDGSGQPGVGDAQPSAAGDGSSIALVSTRGGARNIWLQATLQIARFDASPSTGVVPGDQLQLIYSLPADADVTLQVLDSSGKPLKSLADKVKQAKGTQIIIWDGSGSDGKPLPAGDYNVKLSASIGGGDPIERFTTARVLDAANIGQLALQINQWANTPTDGTDLHVLVYAAGQRISPVGQLDYHPQSTFKLPSGKYDVVVTYSDARREFNGLDVLGGQTNNQTLDLQLGALQVSVLSAPGQPVQDDAFFRVSHSDDSSGATLQYGWGGQKTFVLPPGRYDVQIDYQAVKQIAYGLEVKPGQTTQQEINLGSGVLQINALSYANQPADNNRLLAFAYRPDDHDTVVGQALYMNPLIMRLPAGTYDIQLKYDVGKSKGTALGTQAPWLNGIEVQSGITNTLDYNFHFGVAKVSVIEAIGKPTDNNLLTFFIYPRGQRDTRIGGGLYIDSGTYEIPAGSYDVVANYSDSAFEKFLPATPLEVTEGQTTEVTVNLKAARLHLEVDDAPGQLTDKTRLIARAYPAGQRDTIFASKVYQNPLELVLQSDTAYDIVIELDNKTQYTLTDQTIKEGDTLAVTLNASDFKPRP